MATGCSKVNMSEETFEYVCTACADDNLIKEALKYCLECQRYCCQDCLSAHRWIPSFKSHSFMDSTSVKTQGQPRTFPAFPTKQCSKHAGKIMDIFCKDHDIVCCYLCAVEDHRTCDSIVSVSDNIDQLYSKTDTSKTGSDINTMLDDMHDRQNESDDVLQQLRESKESAIKSAKDFREEMQHLLRKLEEASINEIEKEFKKLETELLKERKRYEDSIDHLKNLEQLLVQASGNVAQQFVCSKIAQQYIKSIETGEISSATLRHTEVIFQPLQELKANLESRPNLGNASAFSPRRNLYKCTKTRYMDVKQKYDTSGCCILGSCVVDDTVLFTDYKNDKLKRFDVSASSLIDYCEVPESPRGVCMIGDNEVAVACKHVVHFVSTHDGLSLTHSINMNHNCYGIAYHDDMLYITDRSKSLYMYDKAGNILKTVSSDSNGRALFKCSNHITFNNKNMVFVGDEKKGLICLNGQCDYMETITDPDMTPSGVCVDDDGNVIVANYDSKTVVQCDRNGQKRGIFIDSTNCPHVPRSVCFHPRLKRMFVSFGTSGGSQVRVYHLH